MPVAASESLDGDTTPTPEPNMQMEPDAWFAGQNRKEITLAVLCAEQMQAHFGRLPPAFTPATLLNAQKEERPTPLGRPFFFYKSSSERELVNRFHHPAAAKGHFLSFLDIHVLVADLADIGAILL